MSGPLTPTLAALRSMRWDLCIATSSVEEALAGRKVNMDLLRGAHRRLRSGAVYLHPDVADALPVIVELGNNVLAVFSALLDGRGEPESSDTLHHALSYFEDLDKRLSQWSFAAISGLKPAFDMPPTRARAFVAPNPHPRRDN